MNKLLNFIAVLFAAAALTGCSDSGPDTPWANSVSTASDGSSFSSSAADSSGNLYAVGTISGSGSFTFNGTRSSATVSGKNSSYNAVIVKYSSDGSALWAKSVSTASGDSGFYGITTDSDGNIYAAGTICGSGSFTFDGTASSATVSSKDSYGNTVIVKYSSDGSALWAKSVSTASEYSHFNSVTEDPDGNIYAAGIIYKSGSFTFDGTAASATVSGKYSDGYNPVIVKYLSDGSAKWAKSVSTASAISYFNGVTADPDGNIYCMGYIYGSDSFTFDGINSSASVSVSGKYSGGYNAVIVKYVP